MTVVDVLSAGVCSALTFSTEDSDVRELGNSKGNTYSWKTTCLEVYILEVILSKQ